MTGTVTGFTIGKNKNSSEDVVLLQVRLRDDKDIQTIEYMTPPGDDSIPPNGAKVIILQVSPSYKVAIANRDKITPTVGAGEKMIYSQASDAVAAFIKLLNTGIIELNGNSDFAVRFNALQSAINTFIGLLNTALSTKLDGGGAAGTLTLDISSAKVNEVKII